MLRGWKRDAEARSFREITGKSPGHSLATDAAGIDPAIQRLIDQLGLPAEDDIEAVAARVHVAAVNDIASFKQTSAYPQYPIELNLALVEGGDRRVFQISGLAAAVGAFSEITIVAPPGTGKSTTLLQATEAIVSEGRSVALFIPLGEWSSQPGSLFESVARRRAFNGFREQHFMLLAHHGRLVFALDGWNELDIASRRRAEAEIKQLTRDYPHLAFVISTRRQALAVPIRGKVVEIDILNEDQQRTIAHSLKGAAGVVLLDHAWRTRGLRELMAIPLYLTALLTHADGPALPTTKEEVLQLFVAKHEENSETAALLRNILLGCQAPMLTALAVAATNDANTAISVARSHAVVKIACDDLIEAGQISAAPQPLTIIDVLTDKHLLVRSGGDAESVSFQHQQFQEWFASAEAEKVMRAVTQGDTDARRQLREQMLDRRAWEEPVLFACERVSRSGEEGARVVASAVVAALAIDPILAGEMIFRSADVVWEKIRHPVLGFIARWHRPGHVDRAARFMVTSARAEFADRVWALIENPDQNVHIDVLRTARRFRPSVLGAAGRARLRALPDEIREAILDELAMRGDINGLAIAAELAKSDPSPAVQVAVYHALRFRRADRLAGEVLHDAPAEVWSRLAEDGYREDITDAADAVRMRRQRERLVASEAEPTRRINLLLNAAAPSPADAQLIAEAIEGAPAADQHTAMAIARAAKFFPDRVASALLRRLEAGRNMPYGTQELMEGLPTTDQGPIAAMAVDLDAPPKQARIAASLVGPNTVTQMITALLSLAKGARDATGRPVRPGVDQLQLLGDRISASRVSSLVPALLSIDHPQDPHVVGRLATILARHGSTETRDAALAIDEDRVGGLVALLHRWTEVLLTSAEHDRYPFGELAAAIGRTGRPELLPDLKRLLDEDLARWRQAREIRRASPGRLTTSQQSDAGLSLTLEFRQAFAGIGGAAAMEMMSAYLEDPDFGFDAACVLKTIWDRAENVPKEAPFGGWPNFSEVVARREQRSRVAPVGDSRIAEMIFDAIERLIASPSSDARQNLAIALGRIALSMPHSDRTELIGRLIDVPRPILFKRELFAALVLDGETIAADHVLDAILNWIADGRREWWRLTERLWEVEGWLELLPFSDRPMALIEATDLLNSALPQLPHFERAVAAIVFSPSQDREQLLGELLRRFPALVGKYEWANAYVALNTPTAGITLIEQFANGTVSGTGGVAEMWLSDRLALLAQRFFGFKSELIRRLQAGTRSPERSLIERTLTTVGDETCLLALVRSVAGDQVRTTGSLRWMMENVALDRRPSDTWAGAYDLLPVPLTELRKSLFDLRNATTAEAALATDCLRAIDDLRDEYGAAESEPRHPDIRSGKAWPPEADGIEP
jgi:hypothetical protein